MALSERTKEWLESGLGNKAAADEIRAALEGLTIADAEAATVIAAVGALAAVAAPLGATTNLVGVDGTANNAAPLAGTEARLDAIEAKIDAVIAATNARVTTLQTKIDALIAALKVANLMASS